MHNSEFINPLDILPHLLWNGEPYQLLSSSLFTLPTWTMCFSRAPVKIERRCFKSKFFVALLAAPVSSFCLFCGCYTLHPDSGIGILVSFIAQPWLRLYKNNNNVIVVNGFSQGVAFHVELMLLRYRLSPALLFFLHELHIWKI